jgi:hypothetical protein
MTTQEFITKNIGVASERDRKCSSVFADHSGNIYSYGYHYPLLFKVGELTFRNNTGYSNTTAKHINWAGQADRGAIDVWLSGCNQYSWRNSENAHKVPALLYALEHYATKGVDDKPLIEEIMRAVFADLEAELVDINERIASKKRTDTQIYKSLMAERSDCVDRIASVRPYVVAK